MSRTKGAPWEYESSAGGRVEEGMMPQRAGAQPPVRPTTFPLRVKKTKVQSQTKVERYAPTRGWPRAARQVVRGSSPSRVGATRSEECRERMEKLMMPNHEGADRVSRTKTRVDEGIARQVPGPRRRSPRLWNAPCCTRDQCEHLWT